MCKTSAQTEVFVGSLKSLSVVKCWFWRACQCQGLMCEQQSKRLHYSLTKHVEYQPDKMSEN